MDLQVVIKLPCRRTYYSIATSQAQSSDVKSEHSPEASAGVPVPVFASDK